MLFTVLLECKTEKRNSQCEHEEACFACGTQVWIAVNHNTSVTSGKLIRFPKRIAGASDLGSCQSNLCLEMKGCKNLKIQ